MPIYMKIDGIKGSGTGKHQGWIVLETFQLGPSKPVPSAIGQRPNGEASSPSFGDIVVTKIQDDASRDLFRMSLQGPEKKVVIHFAKAESDTEYVTIELEDVMVTTFNVSGSRGDSQAKPHESMTLNYSKIVFKTKAAPSAKEQKEWRSIKDRGS